MNKVFNIFIALGFLFLLSCNNNTEVINEQEGNTEKETMNVTEAENKVTSKQIEEKSESSGHDLKPELLTAEMFREKVWDYEANPEAWVYNGDLPCVVDFYADWCKPCKMVAPIMDELADYYEGRVIIYKVDTDKQRELATVFQVKSIPAILFAPTEGKPAMQPGAMKKEDYIKIIDEFILKTNENNKKQV